MCGLKLLLLGLQPQGVQTLVRTILISLLECHQEQNQFSWLSSYFHIRYAQRYVGVHTPQFQAFLQDNQLELLANL